MDKIKVLFVCTGNICRSPLAEAILNDRIKEFHLTDKLEAASAGTSAYHVGQKPDARTIAVARQFNLELSHLARQITVHDLHYYDYVLVMDHLNYEQVTDLSDTAIKSKIFLLRSFDLEIDKDSVYEVPDPYYGGESDFEEVFNICKNSIDGFLQYLANPEG